MRAPHSAAIRSIWRDARDRDDPRQHRHVDAAGAQPVDEAAVVVVVEEQLGDEHAHAGVDLRAQVREVLGPAARVRVRLRVGGAEHAEARPRRRARSARASSARRPPARVQVASPRGGSPRSASTLSAPPARGLGEQRDQPVAREAGRGDVRDGLQPALARQPAHDRERQVARRAARAAGDRHERRLERRELLDRAPERQLGLDRARRQELERDDRLAAAQALVDASSARHRRQDRDLVAVGDRGLEPVEEADVLALEVDVDEAAQRAVAVGDPLAQLAVLGVEARRAPRRPCRRRPAPRSRRRRRRAAGSGA